MPDLYDEYIKAVSKNVVLNILSPSDRLNFYCLLIAKDYAGVYEYIRKKIPNLYSEIEKRVRWVLLEDKK